MKKTLVAAILMAATSAAQASTWNISAGATSFDIDDSISIKSMQVGVGYEVKSANSNWSFLPELRLGTGLGDESLMGVDVEIDRLVSFSARGNYQVNDLVGVYVQPAYTKLTIGYDGYGMSESEDSDWELGVGAGVTVSVGSNSRLEFGYDRYDDADALTVGYRYKF